MSQIEQELPDGYSEALIAVNVLIHDAQHHAQRMVDTAMRELYWDTGRIILERQSEQPWGSKTREARRSVRKRFGIGPVDKPKDPKRSKG